jgi:hypothetical protein
MGFLSPFPSGAQGAVVAYETLTEGNHRFSISIDKEDIEYDDGRKTFLLRGQ